MSPSMCRGTPHRYADLRGRDGGEMHKYPLEAARAVLDLHVLDLCTGDPLTELMRRRTIVKWRERRRGHKAPRGCYSAHRFPSHQHARKAVRQDSACRRLVADLCLRRRGNRRPLGAADRPRWLAMRRLAAAPDPDAVRVEAAQDQRAEQQRQRRCEPVV